MLTQTFKKGVFKEELKNRFLCLVDIDGVDTLCYIPSSCRFSNFIDLTGKEVLLLPVVSQNSRTKYSIYAFSIGNKSVLLNMSKANEIIERNIKNRRFSLLGKRSKVKKEYIVEGYKCDLYIENTKTIIEIKSILSFARNDIAQFPSVYSQRAIDQLMKLSALLDRGYKVCYIFVSLNSKIKSISVNKQIEEYCRAFSCCIDKGMKVIGVTLKLVDTDPIIKSSIEVVF